LIPVAAVLAVKRKIQSREPSPTMEVEKMSTKSTQSQFDKARADAFSRTLLTVLNHGGLCLMVSVAGHLGRYRNTDRTQ
jgi:hypothetical protein